MKKLLLLIFLVCTQIITAQDETQTFNKYRVLLKTGKRIEVEKGLLKNTTLINYDDQKNPQEIPMDDIRALDKKTGTKALLGAGIGVGIGLLSSIAAVAEVEADPNRELKANAGAIIAGITAGCGVIGLIVGSMYDSWEKVPLINSLKGSLGKDGLQISIKISL